VHANIAKFGGDAKNITLAGSSAGSIDINALMTSPLSKDLFGRVIGQSGPVTIGGHGAPLTLRDAEKNGEALGSTWKAASASLRDLRAVLAVDILKAQAARPPSYLGVTVDGYVLPKSRRMSFRAVRHTGRPSYWATTRVTS
jgi:para-nitrobenzyl esterase